MMDRENVSSGTTEGGDPNGVVPGSVESLPAIFSTRLAALAQRQGISIEAALAQAIRLDEMVLDTKSRHGQVLLVENGRTFEVNFR